MWILVLGAPLLLAVLAALSFIASARGHWFGPALAAPAVILGILLFLAAAGGKAPWIILLISLSPAAVGIASISLWTRKRRPY